VALIVLLAAMAVPFAALGTFYTWYQAMSFRWAAEAGLPESHANAIKHARAAFEVHQALDWFRIFNAEAGVLWLGKMNEYAERYVKNVHDSTREVAKDMANNYAGIVAAQWYERHGPACKRHLVMHLAMRDGLKALEEDVPFTPAPGKHSPNIPEAGQWLEQHKPALRMAVEKKLDECLKAKIRD
jgi:hypothetical protein